MIFGELLYIFVTEESEEEELRKIKLSENE